MTKRNVFKMMFQLLALVHSLIIYMLFAVIFGVLGHLSAILIPVLGVSLIVFETQRKLILIVLFNLALLRGVFRYIEQALNHELAFRVLAQLRDKIFKKMRQLAPAKLDSADRGNLISLITGDIEHLEVFFAHTISPVFIALIVNGIVVGLMFSQSRIFALISFVSYLSVGIIIPIYFSMKARDLGIEYRNHLGSVNSFVLERVMGVFDILQFDQQIESLNQLENLSKKLNQSQKDMNYYTIKNHIFVELIIFVSNILLILFGIKQGYAVELIALSLTLHTSSFGPVIALASLANNMYHTLAAGDRVLDLLDEKPQVSEIVNRYKVKEIQEVALDSVSFSYDENVILKDVNLLFEEKVIYGIQGESGSGKSTILKLLMRYYDVDKGQICFNHQNINHIASSSLRDRQAYMSQTTDLFTMSIRDNIRIGRWDACEDEIVKAARKAGIHDFIMSLSSGYDTNVAQFGSSLSSGERQRIALARIFLKDSNFIILDEPTSHLDSLNEAMILNNIKEHTQNKLVLLTSHRESTLSITDKRIFMKQKTVLKSG